MTNSTDKPMANEASASASHAVNLAVNPAVERVTRHAADEAEASLPVMDENAKDRTVTIIAIISITVVGLLGLWLIFGAMRSTVSAGDEAAVAPKAVAAGRLMPSADKGLSAAPPVSATLPAAPVAEAAGGGGQKTDVIKITGQVANEKSLQSPQSQSVPAALPAVKKTLAATEIPAAEAKVTEVKTADVLVSEPLAKPRKPRPAQQYGVQLGVFNSVANAENLRKKMQAQGVPVVIESRVHIGPFATQAEAEQARAKLKAMGVEESAMVILK